MREEHDSIIKDDEASGWQAPGQVQRSYQRQRRSQRHKRKRFTLDTRKILMLVSCAVLVYSLVQLGAWGLRAINTHQTNAQLQAMREEAMRNAAMATQAPIMTPAPTAVVITTAEPVMMAEPQRTPVALVTATPIPQSMLFYKTSGEILPELRTLQQQNSDLIGWLTIPGVVDLPVVYRDNTYYLTRDFYKKNSKGGTLFLDENHPLERTTQHLVIHGHNMSDGSMFGLMAHYRNKSYLKEHGIVTFSTLYEKAQYAVVAVSVTPADVRSPEFIPFIGIKSFADENSFSWYMDKVKAGALYQVYMDVNHTDALLTLSTCLDDDRLLLVCRRLRPGETVESVKRLQQLSTN